MLTKMKNKLASPLAANIAILLSNESQNSHFTEQQIADLLELPKNSAHGDLAFPCFAVSKILKKNPAVVAQTLGTYALPSGFKSTQVVGGYLNFFFEPRMWQDEVLTEIQNKKEKIGNLKIGAGKTVVIDYSSPNVAKPMSIGHLRSTVIGQSLSNIFKAVGYKVVGINYIGDWGVQFGKLAWAHLNNSELLKFAEKHQAEIEKKGFDPEFWQKLIKDAEKPDGVPGFDYLFAIYVIFHAIADFEPSLEDHGREYFLKLESRKQNSSDPLTKNIVAAWEVFVQISLVEYQRVYTLLGTKHDLVRGESFYEDLLGDVVTKLKKESILIESEGAQVVDLTPFDMPPCLIQKKDGATLYATRDLAAALNRHEEFKSDRLIYVVGAEQTLHFRQVFKVLELMKYNWAQQCHHVSFGLYRFKDGKMSTRRGNVILLEDVLDKAVEMVREIIKAKNPDLANSESVAKAVGTGAVIFNDLMNDRQKSIDFDWEKLLDFNGDTGPYVQYIQVRCASVLAKWNKEIPKASEVVELTEKLEKDLLRIMGRFEEVVEMAHDQLRPSWIAQYLLELAKAFSSFYYEHRILEGPVETQKARIVLVESTREILLKGLSLLGIQAPQSM